jgi:hypothetical protein
MATNKTVKVEPFKRGDTPTFRFSYSNPHTGFSWTGVTIDAAMTSVEAPADNTGAAATRLNQAVTTDAQGAHYEFTLTVAESKALTVDTEYKVEAQLKEGTTSVSTPVTIKVKVLQDWVI